jgi:hypothetical protein
MCKGWEQNYPTVPLGFTIFHEIIHMISPVRDINGAYSKVGAHTLAVNAPTDARMSANNYMLYAAQTGLEHEPYLAATESWGTFVMSPTCNDSFANCGMLPFDCCGDQIIMG